MLKGYMCVGGPLDGQRVMINGTYLRVLVLNEPEPGVVEFHTYPKVDVVEYRLKTFAGTVKPISILTLENETFDQVLEHLITNYRPTKEQL